MGLCYHYDCVNIGQTVNHINAVVTTFSVTYSLFGLVAGHLTDDHLAQFLKRCQKGLRPNGIICVKDNVSQEGVIEDEVDSSVCRELSTLHTIVQLAGLNVLAEEKQEDFPDEIYQVYSLALR